VVQFVGGYSGEYRLRLLVADAPIVFEETFTLTADAGTKALTAKAAGAITQAEEQAFFSLGILAPTQAITLSLARPSSSGLVAVLTVLRDGLPVVTAAAGATALSYTVPDGGEGDYTITVEDSGGAPGLLASYLLDVKVTDAVAPRLTDMNLP